MRKRMKVSWEKWGIVGKKWRHRGKKALINKDKLKLQFLFFLAHTEQKKNKERKTWWQSYIYTTNKNWMEWGVRNFVSKVSVEIFIFNANKWGKKAGNWNSHKNDILDNKIIQDLSIFH